MILDTEVEIAINSSNIKWFENKGYLIPRYYNKNSRKFSVKRGTKIKVNVLDLNDGSNALLNTACDYCQTKKVKSFKEYNVSINTNEFIKKYCCENCDHLKKKEIYEYKQSKGLLNRGDKGYWLFKENIMKELDNYIKEKGTITNMQQDKLGACILYAIKDSDESVDQCCLELGYDISSLRNRYTPPNFYDNFDNLKNGIQELIDKLGRFPKQKEVLTYLKIGNPYLLNFGGIHEIKKLMDYCDENDLIDDRGFRNSSVYEYMTAQYLIENSIPYKREQYPFTGEHSRLRSDFTFYLENDKETHIEIWGYSKRDLASKRSASYNEKRIEKEKLYKQYGHNLIGIEYEVYQGKYEEIQNRLFDIFRPHLKLKYKNVSQNKFIPTTKLTNEELLNEILKFSSEPDVLPLQSILQENGMSSLYLEVLNRYDSYFDFATKFNKQTTRKRSKWNNSLVFQVFDYMISNYGYILKNEEIKQIKDKTILGIIEGSKNVFGSMLNAKLSYYEYIIKQGSNLSEQDLRYVDDALNIRKGFNKKYITDEVILRLKFILENSMINIHK